MPGSWVAPTFEGVQSLDQLGSVAMYTTQGEITDSEMCGRGGNLAARVDLLDATVQAMAARIATLEKAAQVSNGSTCGNGGGVGVSSPGGNGKAACELWASHPPAHRRLSIAKYWMYGAASAGCKTRVQLYVEEEGLNPHASSENCKYTALDYAIHARNNGVPGASEVVEYLKGLA